MGENSTGLHGQQRTASTYSVYLPPHLSFFPLLQKDVDAEIIPEKSKINAMRKTAPLESALLFVNVNRSATGQLRGYKYSHSTDAG